jgi:hypothetical protein
MPSTTSTAKKKPTTGAEKTQVGFVSALVDKYGSVTVSIATLIIAIVFCMWFTTRQVNWMQNQFERMQEKNNIELVETIQTTVDDAVKCALDQRDYDHNQRAMRRIAIGPRVQAEIKRGLVDIGCDDILVCEYHNGYTNIATSLPFCRYSVTYEAVRPGFTQIANDFQGLSISPLITMCEPGKVSCFTKNQIKDIDSYIYYFVEREKVRELWGCPIVYKGVQCGVVVAITIQNHNVNQDKLLELSNELSQYLQVTE